MCDNVVICAGCVLLVHVPRDVRPGHALRHDDPHQLVPAGHQRRPQHLRRQPRGHVGEGKAVAQYKYYFQCNYSNVVTVQIVSSWLAGAIYLWTMIAPAVLQDRDFGY